MGDMGISILRILPFYSEVRQERKDTVTAERKSFLWQCSSLKTTAKTSFVVKVSTFFNEKQQNLLGCFMLAIKFS